MTASRGRRGITDPERYRYASPVRSILTGHRDHFERTMDSLGDPAGVVAFMAFLASDDADHVRGTVFTR